MNPLKWFLNLFPPESDDSAGWGPFRLPDDASWMQRAARLHDWDYVQSGTGTKRRSEADWDLFYRWTLEAKAEQDPILRCRKVQQICDYWPLARKGGVVRMGYVKGYLEALDKCEEICTSYIADLRKQAGPAKISVACINNIVEFLRDDIQAHALAIREDNGIPDSKSVLSMGLGETDHPPALPHDLGSTKRWQEKPLGSVKGFGRGFKKRGS